MVTLIIPTQFAEALPDAVGSAAEASMLSSVESQGVLNGTIPAGFTSQDHVCP
jgi:hypothetical protein